MRKGTEALVGGVSIVILKPINVVDAMMFIIKCNAVVSGNRSLQFASSAL